jgi:hypothetical protein
VLFGTFAFGLSCCAPEMTGSVAAVMPTWQKLHRVILSFIASIPEYRKAVCVFIAFSVPAAFLSAPF